MLLLFSTRVWACGYCGLILDELVGLSIYCALLGYFMCGGTTVVTLLLFFLGRVDFSNRKKWPFHDVLSIIGHMTRFSSVSQFWYVGTMFRKLEEPSFGGGENTRCRTCLDELSRTYSETSSRRVICYLCVHGSRRDWPWCRVR